MKYPVCCTWLSGRPAVVFPVPYVSSRPSPSSTAWSGISGHSARGRGWLSPVVDHAPSLLLPAAAAQRETCKRPPNPVTAPAEARAADLIKSLRLIFLLL